MSPTTGTAEFFRVNVLLLSRNSLYGNEFRLCVNTDRWKELASLARRSRHSHRDLSYPLRACCFPAGKAASWFGLSRVRLGHSTRRSKLFYYRPNIIQLLLDNLFSDPQRFREKPRFPTAPS